jgi:MFS superfamily sulfate permease-like transporter
MGLFLANSIAGILVVFPMAIVGAMMFLVGIELTKFAKDIRLNKDLIPMAVTVIVSLATNMAYGFLAGLLVYYLIRFVFKNRTIAIKE